MTNISLGQRGIKQIFGILGGANRDLKAAQINEAINTFKQTGTWPTGIKVPGKINTIMKADDLAAIQTPGVRSGVKHAIDRGILTKVADKLVTMGADADGFILKNVNAFLKPTGVTLTTDDLPKLMNGPFQGQVTRKQVNKVIPAVAAVVVDRCLQSKQLCAGGKQGQEKRYGETFTLGVINCLVVDTPFTADAFMKAYQGLQNDDKVYCIGKGVRGKISGYALSADQMTALQNGATAGNKILTAIKNGTPGAIFFQRDSWAGIPMDQKAVDKLNGLDVTVRGMMFGAMTSFVTNRINDGKGTVAVTVTDVDAIWGSLNTGRGPTGKM